ncbi:hypothetical protein [Nocardia camponoti]|uniref:hypothetical protein n=1 Tax=Nocardia camponoti TaxID=1616106 RepID=UPI001E48F7DB|nr:hypothetical protein [Nocardia camponoti]
MSATSSGTSAPLPITIASVNFGSPRRSCACCSMRRASGLARSADPRTRFAAPSSWVAWASLPEHWAKFAMPTMTCAVSAA